MEAVANLITAIVVPVIGLLLFYYLRDRFAALEGQIAGVRHDLDGRITGVRHDLDGRITGVRDELRDDIRERFEQTNRRIDRLEDVVRAESHAVRADLTRVALAVGAEPRSDTG